MPGANLVNVPAEGFMGSLNLHFLLIGKAKEEHGDAAHPVPWPPSLPLYIPAVGDFVNLPRLPGLLLQVVAREWRFEIGGPHIDVYLDTLPHDAPPRTLKLVK
jgi:hypothetical protein